MHAHRVAPDGAALALAAASTLERLVVELGRLVGDQRLDRLVGALGPGPTAALLLGRLGAGATTAPAPATALAAVTLGIVAVAVVALLGLDLAEDLGRDAVADARLGRRRLRDERRLCRLDRRRATLAVAVGQLGVAVGRRPPGPAATAALTLAGLAVRLAVVSGRGASAPTAVCTAPGAALGLRGGAPAPAAVSARPGAAPAVARRTAGVAGPVPRRRCAAPGAVLGPVGRVGRVQIGLVIGIRRGGAVGRVAGLAALAPPARTAPAALACRVAGARLACGGRGGGGGVGRAVRRAVGGGRACGRRAVGVVSRRGRGRGSRRGLGPRGPGFLRDRLRRLRAGNVCLGHGW